MTDIIRILSALAPWLAVMLAFALVLFWFERKSQHFPHQYSTGLCHSPAPGESCNSARQDCVICGEGR